MDNNDDLNRERILEYLYELNKKCRSPDGALVGIRQLQSELKERHLYKQHIARNRLYTN